MKKIIFVAILAILALGQVKAQSAVMGTFVSSHRLPTDTITNTSNNTIATSFQTSYKYVTIQPVITKISGTITAATTPQLQGSVDGINYVNIVGDTCHLTNQATNTCLWALTAAQANPYYYFRITYTGSGTMVATLGAKILYRKSE